MKKLILLIVVCLGMFTYNYTTNDNFVLADQNNHSSKIEKNVKTTNKGKSNNKKKKAQNIFSYDFLKSIPTVIAVFSVLLTFSYYIYEALSLNDSEKKILKLKDRFLNQISLPAILSVEFFLCIYLYLNMATMLSKSDKYFFSSFTVAMFLIVILYLYVSFATSNMVKVIVDYKEYEFLHRIDDNRFSAKIWGYKENTKTYIFPMSILDKNFLLLEPKKTKKRQRIFISCLVVFTTSILIFSLQQLLFLSITFSLWSSLIFGILYFIFMSIVYIKKPINKKY